MSIDPLLNQHQTLWWNELNAGKDAADTFFGTDSTDEGALTSQFQVISDQLTKIKNEIASKVAATELEANAAELTESFGAEAVQALEEAGISLEEPVTLTMDENGLVRVHGDHPDKEQIEEFFLKSAEWSEKYADVHLRNDLARRMALSNSTGSNSNPYIKNQINWEQVAITLSQEGATVGTI